MKHLPAWNKARRENDQLYNKLLVDVDDIIMLMEAAYAKHVYHIYAIRTQNRDTLIATLAEKNIHCGIHYPIPIHLQEAYRFLEYKKDSFPVAERCADEIVSLPMFPELSQEQIEGVSSEIKRFLEAS